MNTFDINVVREFIKNSSPNSMVYLGCDSQRIRKSKKVRYAVVVVVHDIDENKIGHGAKIFGYSDVVDYNQVRDDNPGKPFNRLFLEVQKIAELYNELEEVLIERDFEIHLDINSKASEGSNVVAQAAIGYILGTIGVKPVLKPDSFASSFGADFYAKGKGGYRNDVAS
jgi:predicted RNase H-related nuclease YkuK (DUF458 family)